MNRKVYEQLSNILDILESEIKEKQEVKEEKVDKEENQDPIVIKITIENK